MDKNISILEKDKKIIILGVIFEPPIHALLGYL